MISSLRYRPTTRHCPQPSRMLQFTCRRPRVSSPVVPHRFTSSRPPKLPKYEYEPWTSYYDGFRKNVYFRIFSLGMLSVTLLYFGSHLKAVPDVHGRRRFMLVSEDSMEKQCVVKYKLLREKLKEHLVGIEDERVRTVHFVLERLLSGNGLTGKGRRWEVMVIEDAQEESAFTQPLAQILPGNRLIITTSTITSLSKTELAHLLSHTLAHMLLQHRRELESISPLVLPFMWTITLLDWRMFLGQLPLLWVIGKEYEKRLDGKDGKLETEANRMARKIAENAGFGKVVAGQEDRWGCGGLVRT